MVEERLIRLRSKYAFLWTSITSVTQPTAGLQAATEVLTPVRARD
jgi:hypothetical protein